MPGPNPLTIECCGECSVTVLLVCWARMEVIVTGRVSFTDGGVNYSCQKFYGTKQGGSTVVDHSPHHPKVEGLSLTIDTGIMREKGRKKVFCTYHLQTLSCHNLQI